MSKKHIQSMKQFLNNPTQSNKSMKNETKKTLHEEGQKVQYIEYNIKSCDMMNNRPKTTTSLHEFIYERRGNCLPSQEVSLLK